MRILLGVAFVIVTGVAAFTYRDLLLKSRNIVKRPVVVAVAQQPVLAASRHVNLDGPTIPELAFVDSMVSVYILALQEDLRDVRSMTDLAFLYMKQGWFDQAIGPLALAREIDATSEPLRRYLELAIARAKPGYVDLYQAARQFEERVAMEGHGC